MLNVHEKLESRLRRHRRVRRTVYGTPQRPRMVVFRSNQHIYAQIIDDTTGSTLASASSTEKEARTTVKRGNNKQAAEAVGDLVAKRAAAKGIQKIVFDRGGYIFHGRVKALADAARRAGLVF